MSNWNQGGPDQETGVYHNSDGSLEIRFDALQRDNRRIRRRELEHGVLSFRADQMLFIVFIEKGDLNPTECIRFVQVKRGRIVARDKDLKPRSLGTGQNNPLTEDWAIDDVDGDGQLGTSRRRDGQVSTSTCDTPQSQQPIPYAVNVNYHVEFILYVVNCCGPPVEEGREKRKKGKKKEPARQRQVLFALPWQIDVLGQVRIGRFQARARYTQQMGSVEVAPPDRSLTPVVPEILTASRVCRPIRLSRGPSPCR